MQSFLELGVSPRVAEALAARDILAPFRIQGLVLPDALAGRDILAKSPTGSGKTLAFAVPLVERLDASDERPSGLVLVPTRELAAQVTAEIGTIAPAHDLRVAAVYGGVSISAQAKASRDAHILVATPGAPPGPDRAQDRLARRRPDARSSTRRTGCSTWASSRRSTGSSPGCRSGARRCSSPPRSTARSASSARAYTTNPSRFEAELTVDQQQGEIDHQFVPVTAENKVETLAGMLAKERGLVLVFVRTEARRRPARAEARPPRGHRRRHARRHEPEPARAGLKRFEEGTVKTLVATDVAARGLDLDDITHVINFDPPEEHTAYIHRIGRTGRAGKNGIGVTLVLPEQQAEVSHVARMLGHTEQFKSEGMTVAPPRLVYASKRRNSKWGPSRPRRKI
jgi:superfamily II DNA/RNA helicase